MMLNLHIFQIHWKVNLLVSDFFLNFFLKFYVLSNYLPCLSELSGVKLIKFYKCYSLMLLVIPIHYYIILVRVE